MRYALLTASGAAATAFSVLGHRTDIAPAPTGEKRQRRISDSYTSFRGVRSDCTVSVLGGFAPAEQEFPWDTAGRWRICAGAPVGQHGGSCFNSYDGIQRSLEVITVEFESDLTELRIHFTNRANMCCWATVDDQLIGAEPIFALVPDGDCTILIATPFTPDRTRTWRIGLPKTYWRGLSTNPDARLSATPRRFRLAMVSASIIQGIEIQNAVGPGVAGELSAWSPAGQLEMRNGIDVWRMAQAATGYRADGGVGAAGHFGSQERIAALSSIPAVDAMVVWDTGLSEDTSSPAVISDLIEAAQSCWTAMNRAQPGVPLIVIGFHRPSTTLIGTGLNTANTELRAAAAGHPGVTAFIDAFDESPITGTGRDGAPAHDGNADTLIASDGVHLTAAGAEAMGEFFGLKIGEVSIPVPR
jgi:hypothetical protein